MANQVILEIKNRNLRPGDQVEGEFLWDFQRSPEMFTVRFGWWTEGRGDRDEFLVGQESWSNPGPIGKETFTFDIPEECVPTFSGKLISTIWGVHLSAKGIKMEEVVEVLTISPTGREIDVSGNSYKSKGKSFSFGKGRGLSLSNSRRRS